MQNEIIIIIIYVGEKYMYNVINTGKVFKPIIGIESGDDVNELQLECIWQPRMIFILAIRHL